MRRKRLQYAGTTSRRRQIILAALECFVEMGFVDATMEDIRVRSKASNGSIYHHFKSKDQLAAAVYLQGLEDYQKGLMDEIAKYSDARDGIYAIVRYHLHWVDQNRVWSRYLFSMRHADFMKGSEDSISQYNRDFESELSNWFKKHIFSGDIRRLPSEMYVCLIWGPCQEYAKFWLSRDQSPGELELAVNLIAESAWQALGTKKATF